MGVRAGAKMIWNACITLELSRCKLQWDCCIWCMWFYKCVSAKYKCFSQVVAIQSALYYHQFWGQKKSAEEAVDENSQTITRNLDYDSFLNQRVQEVLTNTVDLHSTYQDWETGNPTSVCTLLLKQMHLLVNLFTQWIWCFLSVF